MLYKIILIASSEILRNRLRSLLTMLGVVIGVGSVIGMVMLGDGATANVTASISALGENMMILSPGASRRGPGRVSTVASEFELSDARAIRRQVPGLAHVAPSAARQALVVFGSNNHQTLVMGTTPEYFEITGHSLGQGRWMNAAELATGRPVCLLGQTVVEELFGGGQALGSAVRIGNLSCQVIGTLADKGTSTFRDPNDVVVMPLRTYQRRVSGSTGVSTIYLSTMPGRSSRLVQYQTEVLMRERRHLTAGEASDFNVRDMAEIIEAVSATTSTMTALLGGIAAVSLLVGGIGIMNIMLVSVTERTREIGLRLALGARGTDVMLQFLVEAVVLSLFGGALGVLFGIALGTFGARLVGLPVTLSIPVIVMAFGFSACVGVLFGYLPARKAAHLRPIEALRHE